MTGSLLLKKKSISPTIDTFPIDKTESLTGEWIFPGSASVEDLIALVQNCPSGALQYKRHDGGEDEPLPKVNTVRIFENGPVAVKADITIGDTKQGNRLTLCRCGKSNNKPYCDGSHSKANFVATGEVPIQPSEPLEIRDGLLSIFPVPDGPLIADGNLEVIRSGGAKTAVSTKAALCRCGASENKPYCDGSHAKIGFKSE